MGQALLTASSLANAERTPGLLSSVGSQPAAPVPQARALRTRHRHAPEISVVPGPANPDTHFLELKAASPGTAAGLTDEEIWLPRESQTKALPSETIEQDIERWLEETRPVIFESFEV